MKPPAEIARLLQLVAEQSKEHVFILLDLNGRIVWWNSGAEQVFGRSSAEMLNKTISRLFTPEDIQKGIPEQEIQMALQVGRAEDDRWLVRADGSRFWATGIMVTINDENNQPIGFGKIIRNRTDVKEQLEFFRNQIEELTRENQRKSIFLATLAHELRNPLTPLSSAVQLIRMTGALSPNLEYPIKLIERQVEFIKRLVDDLMDVTRLSTGKLQLNKQTIVLQDIINRAVEATRPLVEEKNHRLRVILPVTEIAVVADSDRLNQVVVNLITNAVKFTPERGQISVKATTEGEEAVILVQDTGIGIAHDMLARIFDLFTQVESNTSHGGLGIGLSLVKDLVMLHGGSVQVRSDGIGKGAEFAVRLPLPPVK
jgi:PAS domain S-box-containing protein